jgi:hypothetical protein
MHERVLHIKFPGSNTASSKGDNMYILKFCDLEDYSIELFVGGTLMIGFFFEQGTKIQSFLKGASYSFRIQSLALNISG